MKIKKVLASLALVMSLSITGCSSNTNSDRPEGWPETFVVTTSVDENNPDADAMNQQFASDLEAAPRVCHLVYYH